VPKLLQPLPRVITYIAGPGGGVLVCSCGEHAVTGRLSQSTDDLWAYSSE
jgi:hypothetical protein